MKPHIRILLVCLAVLALGAWFLKATRPGRSLRFLCGGALVSLGYMLQDDLTSYDFEPEHEHDISPEQIWAEMRFQNDLAASVRRLLPRTPRHPLVAMVVCMDARLDTNELCGDTRGFYYIIRTAGSVIEAKEAEMLELAVEHGVRLLVLTTHTDCAAERAAAAQELRSRFPALVRAVDERSVRIQELLARPVIADRIAAGRLAVQQIDIDTLTERMRLR